MDRGNMTNPVETFISCILQNDSDLEQMAWHEAGHRTMWRLLCPEQPTNYRWREDGLPACMPDHPKNIKIASLSTKDAGTMCAIKLGGIAAEMLKLGIQDGIDVIADWIAGDWCAGEKSRLDWDDDIKDGGDISGAIRIIEFHGAANRGTIKVNLSQKLAAITGILQNSPEFQEEKQEALTFFKSAKARK